MRSLIVMAMFASSLVSAAWKEYTESRDLELAAEDIEVLEIAAGRGSMIVTGSANDSRIAVKASIRVPADEDEALAIIEKNLVLTLKRKRAQAELRAYFDHGMWQSRDSALLDLEIEIPRGLAIRIDDGSGRIRLDETGGDVTIDDGSGSIEITGAANVWIDDGSGDVEITDATGNVELDDGSGGIRIRRVGGTVVIDDGSGSIDVENVEKDLRIVSDGSGSVRIAEVRGTVERDD